MIRRALASLVVAGSLLVPVGHLLPSTAHASNSFTFPVTCPGLGTVTVEVNGNGEAGHVVGTHIIGVAKDRGNASTALDGRLVTCNSPFGPIDVLFPAGR